MRFNNSLFNRPISLKTIKKDDNWLKIKLSIIKN